MSRRPNNKRCIAAERTATRHGSFHGQVIQITVVVDASALPVAVAQLFRQASKESLLSEIKINYKNCSNDDFRNLERFETEIRQAAALKGLTRDVCWEPYIAIGRQWFKVYTDDEQQHFLGGDFGRAFLDRVSKEEFFDWQVHLRDFAEPTVDQR